MQRQDAFWPKYVRNETLRNAIADFKSDVDYILKTEGTRVQLSTVHDSQH
jgi:hypothetical protein